MSSFSGRREEPWSLPRAVDALGGAARAAGRPGWIWIAGMGYPSVGVVLGTALSWLGRGRGQDGLSWFAPGVSGGVDSFVLVALSSSIVFLPLVLVVMRLRAGLARIASPDVWIHLTRAFGKPRLRQAWRAGRGLTWSTFGMLVMLTLMGLAAGLVVALPATFYAEGGFGDPGSALGIALAVLVFLPAVAVLTAYNLVLEVMHQLALQSLVHNRRGVASALIHAWRIARQDPWATGRTLAVDLVLNVTVFVIAKVAMWLALWVCLGGLLAAIIGAGLIGFAGVTRAGYWARAYRALGGLSPDDRVPGLEGETLGLS